jgi:hypothetical protein
MIRTIRDSVIREIRLTTCVGKRKPEIPSLGLVVFTALLDSHFPDNLGR